MHPEMEGDLCVDLLFDRDLPEPGARVAFQFRRGGRVNGSQGVMAVP
jgi:hypothetical protein